MSESDLDPAAGLPTRAASGVTWGLRQIAVGAIGVLVIFFIVAVAASGIIGAAGFDPDSTNALFVQTLTIVFWDAGMVFLVYRLVRSTGASWNDLGLRPPRPRPIRIDAGLGDDGPWTTGRVVRWVFGGYAASFGLVIGYNIVINLLGLDFLKPSQQFPDQIFNSPWLVAIIGASAVLLAPVAEEIFFRGFLFGGLRRSMPFLPAALISGALFSLAHVNPGLVIPFTGVGFIFAYIYERTGTLYSSIGVHFTFNLLSFLALILIPEARG